jgi:hypothetical protein
MKILVNDIALDLFPNTENQFFINKQIYDIRSLQTRNADFTRSLKLPASPKNLDTLNLITNQNNAGAKYDCILVIDGITITKGTLLIVEYDQISILISIYSGNFDLFNAIPETSIKELNLNSYNISWTVANMNAYDNTTEGLIITQIEYKDQNSLDDGTGIPTRLTSSTDIKQFGFCFYMKTLIELIINNAGYSYDDSNLTAYDDYNNLVLICPVLYPGVTENIVFAKLDFSSAAFTYDSSVEGGAPKRVNFDTTISDTSTLWNNTLFEFTIPATGEWRIIFDYTITYSKSADNNSAFLEVLNNGANLDDKTYIDNVTNQNDSIDVVFNAVTGDKIYIECTADNPSDVVTLALGSYVKLQENKDDPNELIVSDWLPDITQRELFREFIKQFNVLVSSNPLDKTTNFLLWNDYINETPNDLSSNLDASKPYKEIVGLQSYYKRSWMKYDNEADRTDTDKIVLFKNDSSLIEEGTILNSLFSGSDGDILNVPYCSASYSSAQNFTINSGSNIFSFANSEDFKAGDYIYFSTQIERIQSVSSKTAGQLYNNSTANHSLIDVQIIKFSEVSLKPRIGIIDKSTTFSPFLAINGYSGGVTTASLYRVYFNNTMPYLYENYYLNMFNSLQTPKILQVWIKLSTTDFYNIDLLKPVEVKPFTGKYHINKIEQWKVNQPCLVELIRLNVI